MAVSFVQASISCSDSAPYTQTFNNPTGGTSIKVAILAGLGWSGGGVTVPAPTNWTAVTPIVDLAGDWGWYAFFSKNGTSFTEFTAVPSGQGGNNIHGMWVGEFRDVAEGTGSELLNPGDFSNFPSPPPDFYNDGNTVIADSLTMWCFADAFGGTANKTWSTFHLFGENGSNFGSIWNTNGPGNAMFSVMPLTYTTAGAKAHGGGSITGGGSYGSFLSATTVYIEGPVTVPEVEPDEQIVHNSVETQLVARRKKVSLAELPYQVSSEMWKP